MENSKKYFKKDLKITILLNTIKLSPNPNQKAIENY